MSFRNIKKELRHSQENLLEAQRVAHVGNWEYDFNTNEVTWSEEVFQVFGLTPTPEQLNFDQVEKLIHPEDRDFWQTSVYEIVAI